MKLLRHAIPLIFHNHLAEFTYFVTSRCNYRCKHCFMLDKLNNKEQELSVDEIRKMAKHIRPLQRVHLGGGEPFLRKDISDIVQVISNDWQAEVICLPTNGSIRSNLMNTVRSFDKNCSRQLRLHFSLNTLENNFGEFIGSSDTFINWEQTYKMVKAFTDKSPNITLLTLLTFNDYNQTYFEKLLKYVTTSICPDDVSIGLVRPHKNYNPVLDIEKYRRVVENYFAEASTQNSFLKAYRTSIRDYLATYYLKKQRLTKCYSGKMRLVMSPDGDVYPCETEGYPEGTDRKTVFMGNIRDFDYNINALLNSSQAIAVCNKIDKNRCHCSQGIDLSLSLLCSNSFKVRLLNKWMKIVFTDTWNKFKRSSGLK